MDETDQPTSETNNEANVLVSVEGRADSLSDINEGKRSYQRLSRIGWGIWSSYPGDCRVDEEGLAECETCDEEAWNYGGEEGLQVGLNACAEEGISGCFI